MAPVDAEVDVLIVGGGPVGLTARALLARWGVPTLLVEKYRKLSPFPRSRLINVRSMEIFRQLGLDTEIAARAFAPEYGRIRFRETFVDPDFASAGMIGINAPIPESPVIGAVSSQDRLEPTLLGAAGSPLWFGAELTALTEDADGVVATVGGRSVRARYVLAADGANSTTRELLGIITAGPGSVGTSTTVVFDADLQQLRAAQPAGVYVTTHGSLLPLYPEGGWAWIGTAAEDDDFRELVLRSIGTDVPIDISRVQHWVVNAFVAQRFRHGRVLLAGDAAHAITPAGGLGMNTGIADVHNLCWKLAGVLRGWARPSLLDTYEPERQPVAHRTLRESVANAMLLRKAQAARQTQIEAGASGDDVELPWSDRYFAQLGLVLGVAYGSDATEPGTDYVPTMSPGHRMPHLDLGNGRSTLDAIGEWFTLFTADPVDPEWKTGPWPVRVERLPDASHGTLLVRPDGHIGAVWTNAVWTNAPAGDEVVHRSLAEITE